LHKALDAVSNCECEEGCGQCVESPQCKEGNLVSSKTGALLVLQGLLDVPIDAEALPDVFPVVGSVVAHEYGTIVEAQAVSTQEGVVVEKEQA
jgi:DEAD/DEAH box helicase domain-containing protein